MLNYNKKVNVFSTGSLFRGVMKFFSEISSSNNDRITKVLPKPFNTRAYLPKDICNVRAYFIFNKSYCCSFRSYFYIIGKKNLFRNKSFRKKYG